MKKKKKKELLIVPLLSQVTSVVKLAQQRLLLCTELLDRPSGDGSRTLPQPGEASLGTKDGSSKTAEPQTASSR